METIKVKVYRLPTDGLSSITQGKGEYSHLLHYNPEDKFVEDEDEYPIHLYITTDEEPKIGDWSINLNSPYKHKELCRIDNEIELERYVNKKGNHCRKIIATTDPKLHTNEVVEEDMHMYKKSLPQIPQSFIEEYCKAGGIDEVLVSVDTYLNIPVGTSVKFNDRLPSTLKEYEGLEGRVIWGAKDRLDVGNNCIKVEFLNKYNNVCNLNASVAHWYESIKHLYYNKVAIDSNNCIIIHPVEKKMYSREEFETKLKEAFHIGYENCQYNHSLTVTARKVDLDKWIEKNL